MILADRFHCPPSAIWRMPADQVVTALHYVRFTNEYDETATELNREPAK